MLVKHIVCHLCWFKKKKKMEKRNSISQNQSLESTFDTKNTEEAQSHEQANANSGSIKGFFA